VRVLITGLFLLGLTACGAAEFSGTANSQKAIDDANGVIAQDAAAVAAMCSAAGLVPKANDSCSDDDSTSTDDDSVDGVSADGVSSDDDSSDDKACSTLDGCIKKKCEAPAPAAPAAPAP